jgi:hypothetical protein
MTLNSMSRIEVPYFDETLGLRQRDRGLAGTVGAGLCAHSVSMLVPEPNFLAVGAAGLYFNQSALQPNLNSLRESA